MSQLGFLLMGIGIAVAYVIFLFQLRSGKVELVPALKVGVVLFFMVLVSSLLDSNSRYQSWDPVWPTATKWIKLISQQFAIALWALVLGWALLAGGTMVPGGGKEKMASFWDYVSFKWNSPNVALASVRGGAIGFAAGAIQQTLEDPRAQDPTDRHDRGCPMELGCLAGEFEDVIADRVVGIEGDHSRPGRRQTGFSPSPTQQFAC